MIGAVSHETVALGVSHMSRRLLMLLVLALVSVFTVAACDSNDASSDVPGAYTVSADEAVEMIENGIAELDAEALYLVYCRSGNRSAQAASQMEDAGFVDIADGGGLADLAAAGAPVE